MSEWKETEYGKVPANWNLISASEYCKKVTDGTHDSPKRQDEGNFLITSKHIKGRNIDFENAYLISKADFCKINERSKVDQWDVIISMIGEYCGFAYLERNSNINYAIKNVGLFKTGDKNNAIWLYYYIQSEIGNYYLQTNKSGTSQPYITLGTLRELPILVPSNIEEQKAIASVLSSLDDKIDLLHRQNETLEAMAETLFRQWFVEEANEGWDTKISELPIEIIDGDRGKNYPKNSELLDVGDCLFLSAKNVTKNGFNFDQCQFITAEKDVLLRSGKLNRNDIVITTRGTVGNIAYYDDLIGYTDIRINSGMIIIRTVSSVMDPIFIFCLIRSNYFKSLIENQTSGSAQPQLPIRDFKQIDVYYPPKEKVDEFLVFAKPCLNKKFYNDSQIEKLEKLRDMLLPKLMSGKVRVEI